MKIHSLSYLIATPFVILVSVLGYFVFLENQNQYVIPLLIFVIIIVALYMFQPQIDFYYYKKNPRLLGHKDRLLLKNVSSFYNSLNETQREKFEKKVYIFMRAKDFKWVKKEKENLPQDMKLLVAANAIQISMALEDYLYSEFDNYFVYSHPFPTPDKQFLHSVEVNFEDKTAIFDLDAIMKSQNIDNKVFNVALFAFAEIFIHLYPNKNYPDIDKNTFWTNIESISTITKDSIISTIGYEPEPLLPVLIVIFFMYPDDFKSVLPNQYDNLCVIFQKH